MKIYVTEDIKNPPECLRNRSIFARVVNEYLGQQLDYKLVKNGLPELHSESRLQELADSGFFYNDKHGNTLDVGTESHDGSHALRIVGTGLCKSISEKMSKDIEKLLSTCGFDPTCKNED